MSKILKFTSKTPAINCPKCGRAELKTGRIVFTSCDFCGLCMHPVKTRIQGTNTAICDWCKEVVKI